MKAIKILLAVTFAVCVAGLAVILWIYRDIPAEVLEARYGSPASQFVMIDGVRLHYRDEGRGQTIVLIHGHNVTYEHPEASVNDYLEFLQTIDQSRISEVEAKRGRF